MEAVILDLGHFVLIFCLSRIELRRDMSKRVRLRHGSHTSRRIEIIFIDPHKGINDDENNVCFWRSTSFRHFCHLSCLLRETCETVIILFHATSMTLVAHSAYPNYDRLAQGQLVSTHCVISSMCVGTKKEVR